MLRQDALDISLKMALSIPLSDVMAYPKVGKAYFIMLESLCHNHLSFIAGCESGTFSFIVSSLEAGLRSLDVSISSMCATSLGQPGRLLLPGRQGRRHAFTSSTGMLGYHEKAERNRCKEVTEDLHRSEFLKGIPGGVHCVDTAFLLRETKIN